MVDTYVVRRRTVILGILYFLWLFYPVYAKKPCQGGDDRS